MTVRQDYRYEWYRGGLPERATWVDGSRYPLTVEGVNAAMRAESDGGGGDVYVGGHSIPLSATVIIPEGVRLRGKPFNRGATGSQFTFVGDGTTLEYGIRNELFSGAGTGQHMVGLRDISINGSKADTAIDHLIYLKGVYVGSEIVNCYTREGSGHGLTVDGGGQPNPPGDPWTADSENPVVRVGPLYIQNFWTASNNDDNILITGSVNIQAFSITSEFVAANKALIRMEQNGATGSTASMGSMFRGIHMESNQATAKGLIVDGLGHTLFSGVRHGGSTIDTVVVLQAATGIPEWWAAQGDLTTPFTNGGVVLENISSLAGTHTTLIDDLLMGFSTTGEYQNLYTPQRDDVFTDATRPAAGDVAPGTVIFNSDDGFPNWSDGTNWVTATGATT